jgi:hypothetical protein
MDTRNANEKRRDLLINCAVNRKVGRFASERGHCVDAAEGAAVLVDRTTGEELVQVVAGVPYAALYWVDVSVVAIVLSPGRIANAVVDLVNEKGYGIFSPGVVEEAEAMAAYGIVYDQEGRYWLAAKKETNR